MNDSDFAGNEKAVTMAKADSVDIEFTSEEGQTQVLKKGLKLQEAEVLDATFYE